MSFRRRKLLNDSLPIVTVKSCTQFCDPTKNLNGLCPLPCLPLCFSTCKGTFWLPRDPPPPPPDVADFSGAQPAKHFRVSLFLTVFLSVLATAFFLFSCYTVYKLFRSWSRSERRQGEDDGGDGRFEDLVDEEHGLMVDHPIWYIRTVGLQSSVINAITVCKYKRGEGLVEGTECSVCLNEFQEDETLRLLPKCNHAFHIPCIDTWLRSHTNCPMCRAGIIANAAMAIPAAAERSLQSSGPVQETEAPQRSNNSSRELIRSEGEIHEGFEDQIELEEVRNPSEISGSLVNSEAEIGIRRSASLDSVSASMVSAAVIKAFAAEFNVQKKAERIKVTSSSSSSSASSSLMKRSLSCGGKIFSARYNRRTSGLLPR